MNVQITLVICEVEEDANIEALVNRVESLVSDAYKFNTVLLADFEKE